MCLIMLRINLSYSNIFLKLAAAEVTVDDFSAELDMPIPGFDVVKPWMPKLNIGGDSTEETTALQVSYCKALVDNMYACACSLIS